MRAIMKMERPRLTPAVYAQIQCCQSTSAAVEWSFFMLGKLLSKDRHFCQQMWKGISVYIQKTAYFII